jgi:hypothetical protein
MKTMKSLMNMVLISTLMISLNACGSRQTETTSTFASLSGDSAALAARFESTMKGTNYISESDYPWTAFYSEEYVISMKDGEGIRVALGYEQSNLPIDIHSAKDTAEMWSTLTTPYADDSADAQIDAIRYSRLKQAMESQLKSVRFIKVGVPDHGDLELFVVGLDAQGHLVGLKTHTVET